MTESNKIINQHIRAWWLQRLKYIIPLVAFCIIVATYSLYHSTSSVIDKEIITGVVVSVHHGQSLAGSDLNHFYVRTNKNEIIKVTIRRDANTPFRKNAKAKIEKTTKESGPIIYTFIGYVE